MSVVTIEISELRRIDDESVNQLLTFLEETVDASLDLSGNRITVNYESEKSSVPRPYLRVLLKKFLHKADLKYELRVISGKEGTFILKERKG